MAVITMKMTDIGEGVSEAELVEWNVAVGDEVQEDDVIATVMTDKAAVEIPAVTAGKVLWLAGAPGDMISIGSDLVRLETGDIAAKSEARPAPPPQAARIETDESRVPEPEPEADAPPGTTPREETAPPPRPVAAAATATREDAVREPPRATARRKPLASPSVRNRARELGVDLGEVRGSGPDGRIVHADLDALLLEAGSERPSAVREIRLAGLRRLSAEKVAVSKARIPHFTIVEETDVTDLDALRAVLNERHARERGKLTILPFIICAMARAIRDHPGINGHFDDAANLLRLSEAVHVGIATQTEAGLMVPVIRNAEAKGLWQNAAEIARLSDLARQGRAARDELTGSTITVTSLGSLGGLVTTPIINHPEIAIIGVNRIDIRPVWDGRAFRPRRMMNLSCSFDHRVIDGWDAAMFVKALKGLLEVPALLFIDEV